MICFHCTKAWSLGPVMGRGSIPWQLDQKAIFPLGEFQWLDGGWMGENPGNLSLERNC